MHGDRRVVRLHRVKPSAAALDEIPMRPTPEHLLDLREYPVLLVDDEPENLCMFERGLGREFSVLTASSGEEALRVVRESWYADSGPR